MSLHSSLGLDAYVDVTDRSSLIVQLEYDYREPLGGGAGAHVFAPGVGLAAMLLPWIELRVLAGPTASTEPGAGPGLGLGQRRGFSVKGAWYAVQILLRI